MANKSQQQAAPIPAASPLPATGTLRGKNKMTPWSPTQIATALEQARRNVMSAQRLVGWLEDLQREQQPEHAMGAGGGSMGG